MKYRQTFVIEYDDKKDVPAASANMEMLGGRLVAAQFSDALLELYCVSQCCTVDEWNDAQKMFMEINED